MLEQKNYFNENSVEKNKFTSKEGRLINTEDKQTNKVEIDKRPNGRVRRGSVFSSHKSETLI